MRRVLVLLALCGCNQLLGLDAADEQTRAPADRDGDGVIDSRDNCIDVANADQADRDHDRIGDACDVCPDAAPTRDADMDGVDDACDTCPLGPNTDDDGDGVFDDCDLCPATPTTDQIDTDGDLVGDACDSPKTLVNEHLPFIAFSSIDADWPEATDWVVAADGTGISPAGSTEAKLTIGTTDQPLESASVRFDLPVDGEVGIELSSSSQCRIACSGATCIATASLDGQTSQMTIPHAAELTIHTWVRQPGFLPKGLVACDLFVADQEIFVQLVTMEGFPRFDALAVFASPGMEVLGADLVE